MSCRVWRTLVAFAVVLGCCPLRAEARIPLPPQTADHIGLAQIGRAHPGDLGAGVPGRAYVWGAPQPGGVYSSFYVPANRDPDRSHDLAWFKANRPDWVVYKCDRTTPAYDHIYADGSLLPIDFTNPEVRAYVLERSIVPALRAGYPSIGFDNVTIANSAGKCGVWRNGAWVQLFSGSARDPAFTAAVLDYVGWLRDEVHKRGAAIALNAKLDKLQVEGTAKLVGTSDIWLDESGFSNDCRHTIVDNVWRQKLDLIAEKLRTGAYVSVNYLCEKAARDDPAELAWILANFLLIRQPESFLAIVDRSERKSAPDPARVDPPIGRPLEAARREGDIYVRRFSGGMVVVNPSAKRDAALTIPPGPWKGLDGAPWTPVASLPPRSGLVLLR